MKKQIKPQSNSSTFSDAALPKCPFCGEKSAFVEKVSSESLIYLYKKYLSVDINYLFHDIKYICFWDCNRCGLQYTYPIVSGDNKFYEKLESVLGAGGYYSPDKIEYSFSKKFIGKNDKVLDIGCGSGMFGKTIQYAYYQGIDFNEKAIEIAKSNKINVQAIPIQKHSITHKEFYDTVVCFQLIEHLGADINDFLFSAMNCIKKGGKLIIAVPDNEAIVKYMVNNCLNLPPHHTLYWNESSLRFLGKKYNLEIETIQREPVEKRLWNRTMAFVFVHKLLNRRIHKVDLLFTKRTGALHLLIHCVRIMLNISGISWYRKKYGHTIIVVYKKI